MQLSLATHIRAIAVNPKSDFLKGNLTLFLPALGGISPYMSNSSQDLYIMTMAETGMYTV